ncbi:MAG: hypothetical protein GF368_01285, partial [Candidatus Aenigmarchaeota archaeon]|nr:hypothetical protein [Candidatus Aenigmarchaeota archaeon]
MSKNVFAGVGISEKEDPFEAGKEAVEMAVEKMKKRGGKEPNFGFLFCSGGKYGESGKSIQKLVDGAHSIFKDTPWVGCTTGGEISPHGSKLNSVVCLVLDSQYIRFGIG